MNVGLNLLHLHLHGLFVPKVLSWDVMLTPVVRPFMFSNWFEVLRARAEVDHVEVVTCLIQDRRVCGLRPA